MPRLWNEFFISLSNRASEPIKLFFHVIPWNQRITEQKFYFNFWGLFGICRVRCRVWKHFNLDLMNWNKVEEQFPANSASKSWFFIRFLFVCFVLFISTPNLHFSFIWATVDVISRFDDAIRYVNDPKRKSVAKWCLNKFSPFTNELSFIARCFIVSRRFSRADARTTTLQYRLYTKQIIYSA